MKKLRDSAIPMRHIHIILNFFAESRHFMAQRRFTKYGIIFQKSCKIIQYIVFMYGNNGSKDELLIAFREAISRFGYR